MPRSSNAGHGASHGAKARPRTTGAGRRPRRGPLRATGCSVPGFGSWPGSTSRTGPRSDPRPPPIAIRRGGVERGGGVGPPVDGEHRVQGADRHITHRPSPIEPGDGARGGRVHLGVCAGQRQNRPHPHQAEAQPDGEDREGDLCARTHRTGESSSPPKHSAQWVGERDGVSSAPGRGRNAEALRPSDWRGGAASSALRPNDWRGGAASSRRAADSEDFDGLLRPAHLQTLHLAPERR